MPAICLAWLTYSLYFHILLLQFSPAEQILMPKPVFAVSCIYNILYAGKKTWFPRVQNLDLRGFFSFLSMSFQSVSGFVFALLLLASLAREMRLFLHERDACWILDSSALTYLARGSLLLDTVGTQGVFVFSMLLSVFLFFFISYITFPDTRWLLLSLVLV